MSLLPSLPSDVYSPDQLGAAVIELQTYIGQLHDANVRQKVDNDDRNKLPEVEFSQTLNSLLSTTKIEPTEVTKLEELATELETIRQKAPVGHITLAALPNPELKGKLVAWFREHIHPAFMVIFTARSDLGGGIVIQTNSHIYNHSFRQRILDNKLKITNGV